MSENFQQQSRIRELIGKGREQGYLTYAEVNDHLPEDISDPDQVEDIIQMINDMGINVFEAAPQPRNGFGWSLDTIYNTLFCFLNYRILWIAVRDF